MQKSVGHPYNIHALLQSWTYLDMLVIIAHIVHYWITLLITTPPLHLGDCIAPSGTVKDTHQEYFLHSQNDFSVSRDQSDVDRILPLSFDW